MLGRVVANYLFRDMVRKPVRNHPFQDATRTLEALHGLADNESREMRNVDVPQGKHAKHARLCAAGRSAKKDLIACFVESKLLFGPRLLPAVKIKTS